MDHSKPGSGSSPTPPTPMNQALLLSITSVMTLGSIPSLHAFSTHFEGFEDPAWAPGGTTWKNYAGADIERVSTGTDGVTSASGTGHGRIGHLRSVLDVNGSSVFGRSSPYTKLGGYSSDFGSGFTTSLDIYLDPTWSAGSGFDYSVAANRQTGFHLRDYIFHVGVVDGVGLLVNGSNNSIGSFGAPVLQTGHGGNAYEVTSPGWYTLQHVFRDDGGVLAVDLNLLDSGGTLLHTNTRSSVSDDITTMVGGNRYGWLAYNNIDGLAIDNTRLGPSIAVPDGGASILLLGLSLSGLGLLGLRRGD